MSEKPIQKGDLVMVIRALPCCGQMYRAGFTYIVQSVFRSTRHRCICGAFSDVTVASCDDGLPWPRGFPISILKRLDPGNLSEDVPTDEKVSA